MQQKQAEVKSTRYRYQTLDAIFKPQSVAVIGATERAGSVGRTILWNLIRNPFGGTVYPINPTRRSVLGIKAYPSIAAIDEQVDLAVIVTPAQTVPGIIEECVAAGVRGAIVISAGFKERGPNGVELERQILDTARRGNMRVVGPNCLGVMSPMTGLNATFAAAMAMPGNVGFISQSGALCTSVLDWSFREKVGFSAFVSIGSMLDVGWGDLIYYLGDDPNTESIVIYMESVGDARSFLSAAREVAFTKPVIVIKAGRTEAAAQAAASHTGSLTGSDEVLDTAFRRSGVLRINSVSDIFYVSEVLAKQPRPKGPRLTILTNAGGPGVLATDALITQGGELAELSEQTMAELNELLPEHWSHGNPVDILGDAAPERYAKSLEIASRDPNSDGLLVILTPQAMSDPTGTAEQLMPYAHSTGKPVLASWMGGSDIAAGEAILNETGIPTFEYADTATRLFNYMWRYSDNLKALYETPAIVEEGDENAPDRELVQDVLDQIRDSGRTILSEYDSKQILAAYGIPTVPMRIATSAGEAVKAADELGYPVVAKLHSETITHKTDVGGVVLNLGDADAVRAAYQRIEANVLKQYSRADFLGVSIQPMIKFDGYELIIGSSVDPQFGPVLLFGAGGTLVEVFKDRALGLPPLNTTLARRMMERTKIYTALKGIRGKPPVDLAALERLLVRFSQIVAENHWIKEIDINPLLASPERVLALDARIVLYDKKVAEADLPQLAVRPYPVQYVEDYTLKDGTSVVIRPIRPEDEPCMVKFHETLSERTVYLRYFDPLKLSDRISHERLARICFIDYAREIILVAERHNPESGMGEIIAASRMSKLHDSDTADFTCVISDDWQNKGLGQEILRRQMDVARAEGVKHLQSAILPEADNMRHVFQKFGFSIHEAPGSQAVWADIDL
ncbi:MAG: bifunctional acetate--CoA ligase family protein/GNAT family N-acetyltransferase [Anaerolineae bacterium]|nr:bifunctional acetate--CoA ligase family protein/GNAT family N-acetyltransferase [Anaerolineae bacterium]